MCTLRLGRAGQILHLPENELYQGPYEGIRRCVVSRLGKRKQEGFRLSPWAQWRNCGQISHWARSQWDSLPTLGPTPKAKSLRSPQVGALCLALGTEGSLEQDSSQVGVGLRAHRLRAQLTFWQEDGIKGRVPNICNELLPVGECYDGCSRQVDHFYWMNIGAVALLRVRTSILQTHWSDFPEVHPPWPFDFSGLPSLSRPRQCTLCWFWRRFCSLRSSAV